MLSILEESSDSEVEIKVNKGYADRYNVWRNKEELQKYKDLKKDDDDSETSSESEEEIFESDEEFLKAISLLKGRDPRIYDKNFELFKEKEITKSKAVKEKPMFMKDYERDLVLKRGGKFSDEEDEYIPSVGPTYDEQQEEVKKSFKPLVDHSDDSEDDLLQVRTKGEKDEDEADYLKWLKGENKEVSEDIKKDMSYLRKFWNDPDLDENEKFLRDYFLNKRYLEKDDAEPPTYEEIVSGQLSEDEKEGEEREKFEHKFNFRFEEPDEEFIKRYPRTVGDSLRKTDNRRKQKREDKAERRRREREQRQEELKRLKALKRKEIEEKFLKLKEISGQEINFDESDMESDFDPDKHDEKMREMFNDDYYGVEELQKPEFPYDEELDSENWNTWAGEKIISEEDEVGHNSKTASKGYDEINDELGCSSKINSKEDFENEMIEATLPKKRVKKKSLFAKVISQPKPIFDPDGKSFDDYLDEYYKLDYEDVVGDMPVRYKYRKVVPNDFGLTVDEILAADDRELNRWCSVKKTCQYRNEDEENYDVQAFRKKSSNILVKKKVFSSLYSPKETDDNGTQHENEKYATGKSQNSVSSSKDETVIRDAAKSNCNGDIEQEANLDSSLQEGEQKNKSKKKKRKGKLNNSQTEEANIDCDRKSLADIDRGSENSDISRFSFSKQLKTSKKKKHTTKMKACLSTEHERQYNEVNDESTNTEAKSDVLDNALKSSKSTKRKHGSEKEFSASKDKTKKDSVLKKKLKKSEYDSVSHMDISASSVNSNVVSESSPQVQVAKKKKKKRKKNKKGASGEEASNHAQHSMPKLNKFKNKTNVLNTSGDKRLGLSDERLAAYGINPKKFKNKIIYSKK